MSELLEELEDRMRHKLDLLTKDNGTDMQFSNLVSLEHAENIQKRATSSERGQEHVLSVAKGTR